MIHESAFCWPGCTHPLSLPSLRGKYNEWGDSLFRGTSLGPSPWVLKILGPTRELPPAIFGGGTHILAMHAGGSFGTSVGRLSVCQSQLSLISFWGRYMSRGGTLGLPEENSWALPRAFNLGTLVTVVTAVLTLPIPSLLVHTPDTKGGGGGEGLTDAPAISKILGLMNLKFCRVLETFLNVSEI